MSASFLVCPPKSAPPVPLAIASAAHPCYTLRCRGTSRCSERRTVAERPTGALAGGLRLEWRCAAGLCLGVARKILLCYRRHGAVNGIYGLYRRFVRSGGPRRRLHFDLFRRQRASLLTSPAPPAILSSGADTPSDAPVSARRSPVGGCCLLLLWFARQSPPLRGLWPLPQPPIRAILSGVGAPPGAPSGAPSRSGTSAPWPVDSDWNGGAPLGFVWGRLHHSRYTSSCPGGRGGRLPFSSGITDPSLVCLTAPSIGPRQPPVNAAALRFDFSHSVCYTGVRSRYDTLTHGTFAQRARRGACICFLLLWFLLGGN